MLQLFLGCLTQTVVDHAVHVAGAALIQILLGNFAITIIAADFQLVHSVRMIGEQSLELDLEANAGECDSDKEFITVGKQRFKQRLIEIGICNVAAQNRDDCDHGNKGQNELG